MLSILFVFIIELLLLTLFNGFGINNNNLSVYLILLHAIFVIVILYKKYRRMSIILIPSFIIRLVAMMWDIYARDIFMLLGSGADSEGFYRVSINISADLSLIRTNVYGGLYTKMLGLISYFTGPNRIVLQYINVILGIFIVLVSYEILQKLVVNYKTLMVSMVLIAFMPLSIIHSAILLRENIISFFVILSLKYFIIWFERHRSIDAFLSLALILLASVFHSGVIGIAFGMLFSVMFYNYKASKYQVTFRNLLVSFLVVLISLTIYIRFNNIFLQKFSNLDSVEQLLITTTQGRGGSQYLTSIKITNPALLLLFTPVKVLYFLSSPLPNYWRGLGDVISFLTDGIIYGYLFINGVKQLKEREHDPIMLSMLISLFSVLIIFGIGINNAGTAMRHRNKLFEYIVIFWSYSKSDSMVKENNNAVIKETNTSK